ncbi:protein tyrosine phosphatase type IVA 1 isoform X1 [Phocoena sinus]|uniref:protein tyrosine phosphatase type IVA 1 isoform X1 n=1 Tax=Phocoena sinus TaxID=42100 RepID=UPI0013C4B340|nr:protein tyrosine phosphatase type IVA 1 isoform X1 [Phocoena sinus]XP_032507428.1 protein tyrosine phosphatase type IVA 1 isoform X1 [Phocoena sinus]XP_032507429.1 protein tyrosine phosphatase type IVA 1 isoform X1 [Phocoena sinus]XP_032507430.1 protein tyrosine phosphatase type IVA 1 isoform X1 [Phocoena sinus]
MCFFVCLVGFLFVFVLFFCGTRASHCCGLSRCGAQAPDLQAQRPWLTHVLFYICFIQELKKYGVTTVVRVCEATYDTSLVEKEGIHVLDWPFDDGAPPSNQIVDDWLSLVKIKFREDPGCCIAVHCVAGLGRAPVLVALALIEGGMKYEDAVQFIRQKRRGAFNSKQLLYLEKYRPKMRLRFKDSNGHRNNCCIQ